MKKGTVSIVMAILLLAISVVAYQLFKKDDTPNSIQTTTKNEPETKQETPDPTERISLVAQEGYKGKGFASRFVDGGTFSHSIIAEIAAPADGKFYEGWLVSEDGFISTGKLEKSKDSEAYALTFVVESIDLAKTHNKVVVTEETLEDGLDGKPETHVLEGSF